MIWRLVSSSLTSAVLAAQIARRIATVSAFLVASSLAGAASAQEMVRIEDSSASNFVLMSVPGTVINVPTSDEGIVSQWRVQQYADCTSGEPLPYLMFFSALDGFVLGGAGNALSRLPFDQATHCNTPPSALPYLFGVEVAETGTFSAIDPSGSVADISMPASVYLRQISTGHYVVSGGMGATPELGAAKTAWRIRLSGTTPPVPPNYLDYFATELAALEAPPAPQPTPTPAPQMAQPDAGQPPAPVETRDDMWRQLLPAGLPFGLTEDGSARGLQVVPSVTVAESAMMFDGGQWELLPLLKRDPVTGAEIAGQEPTYAFRNIRSGYLLALISGSIAVVDAGALDPGQGRLAEIEWEIRPGTIGAKEVISPLTGARETMNVPVNYHIRHAATRSYIFMQNGFLNVSPSQAIAWTFDQ